MGAEKWEKVSWTRKRYREREEICQNIQLFIFFFKTRILRLIKDENFN